MRDLPSEQQRMFSCNQSQNGEANGVTIPPRCPRELTADHSPRGGARLNEFSRLNLLSPVVAFFRAPETTRPKNHHHDSSGLGFVGL